MIKKIKQLVKGASADSEEESKWNGFLSWSAEWHAATLGFAHGAQDPWHLVSPLPEGDTEHEKDARAERAYYYGFSFLGTVLQLALLGLGAFLGYMAFP